MAIQNVQVSLRGRGKEKMDKLVVSAAEAAKLISTSQENILKMIRDGDIKAYRTGNRWGIPVRLLETVVIDRAVEETRERMESSEDKEKHAR